MIYDVAVVGAGFGGLASAAELSRKGLKVILFEASNELGGSAGKFERQGYRFQSGATVGMGFEEGGVFDRLYASLGIKRPDMKLLNPIMDIHLPDRTIHYYQNRAQWYKEIDCHFPQHASQIKSFYDEVFKVGALVDQLVERLPVFPPHNFKDWLEMVKLVDKNSLKLIPYMTQTVEDRLKSFRLESNRLFRTFLNGELMDSVQTSVENCPAFLGYAALQTFHKGAYAVHGGLATIAHQLAEYIESCGNEVLLRHPVRNVEKSGQYFHLHSKRNTIFTAKKVILNNSIHNLHDTLSENLGKQTFIKKEKEKNRESWGAFIIHAGVDDRLFRNTDALYHQFIDPNHPDDLHDGGQFLLSLSDPEDKSMAPEGKRSLTLSTHTGVEPWWSAADYEMKKEKMKNRLIQTVDHYFPGFEKSLDLVLPGTPVTFEKWLRRKRGKVGGYAPTGRFSWLDSYSIRTGIDGVYQCGDTVFPGAGTLGVTLSGLMVAKDITR
ncbi:phytoene desaturase family protein [Halobacillus yeomjeoni]|uniref:FAD-dependent oxidoreductase n=1 Tax=Halobacillus yeomjeoni TaxID=311194 RepID=A0A931HWI4_9BACI|nr:NAD(P)/FAD-dependent oxidoreductase [Halobacillus yeomjeoni]MBH0230486.1 FAD-dependent oxidoreductase [Halobacillus yeomjeoni]